MACVGRLCSAEPSVGFEPAKDDGSPSMPWRTRRHPPETLKGWRSAEWDSKDKTVIIVVDNATPKR